MISVSVLYTPYLWRREGVCLIVNWAAWCRCNGTDTNLTHCLTKINRMDIVHLMETSGIDPLQGHGTRAYMDTEQSLALDHSEGMCLLTQTARGTSLSIALLPGVGPGSSVSSRDRAQESHFESTDNVGGCKHGITRGTFHQVEDLGFSWFFRSRHCGQQRCPVYLGVWGFFAYTSAFTKVQKVVLEFDQDIKKENYSKLWQKTPLDLSIQDIVILLGCYCIS